MTGRTLMAIWSITILATSPLQAQTFKIKLKQHGDVGKKVRVQCTEQSQNAVNTGSLDGQFHAHCEFGETTVEYTTIVTRHGASQPEEFQRVYTKATATKEGECGPLAHEGRTVKFHVNDGTHTVTNISEAGLEAAAARNLELDADSNLIGRLFASVLPTAEVKAGETWELDLKQFAKTYYNGENTVNLTKSSGHGKLVKVYKKGNSQFGIIEVSAKLALQDIPPFKVFDAPAFRELKLVLDFAVDGTSTEARVDLRMTNQGKGVSRRDEIALPFEFASVVIMQHQQFGEE